MLNPVVFIVLLLPWLNPFAPGPSPAVAPLLFAWGGAAALLGLRVWRADVIDPARLAVVAAAAWLLAGLASSGMGLLQYFAAAAAWAPWVNQTVEGQAFANLRQRNQFASLTNIALLALIYHFSRNKKISLQYSQYVAILFFAGLLAIGNAVSSSRTGLIQLFLICGLCAVWRGWQLLSTRLILLVALLAYALATAFLPWLAGLDMSAHGLLARLQAGDQVCASRLTLWSNVMHLIVQKPWLGWGWGELDYAHFMTLYNGPRFCDILDNAHNLPLHLAVELGVPAALLICGGFVWWVFKRRPWRETNPERQLAWSVIALVLLHSMLEYPLWYGPFQIAVGLCVLMLWRSDDPGAGQKLKKNHSLGSMLAMQTAIFLMAVVGYAAWDYYRISQVYLAPEARATAYRDNTLVKTRDSWLFASQVDFAELSLTPLTPVNAQWTFDTAKALLHYSPEPRVIEKLIESATLLGRDDDALMHLARYRAAFPAEHARWAQAIQQGQRSIW